MARIWLVCLGGTAAVAQWLMVRELVAVFYGHELMVGVILAAWMAWVAIGARGLGGRLWWGGWVLPLVGAGVLPLQMALVRRLPGWLTPAPGVQVPPGAAVVATVVVLGPLGVVLGAQFAQGTRLLVAQGGWAARAYFYESLGAVVGGVGGSVWGWRVFDPFQMALFLAALNVGCSFLLAGSRWVGRWLVPLTLGVVAMPLGARWHTATLRAQYGPDLVYAVDSPYGRLVVLARGRQRVFYENGVLSFETQSLHPEAAVHIPLLAHPRPERVLLLGGGVGGDAAMALQHPVVEVVAVEPDAARLAAARAVMPNAPVWDDSRLRWVEDDGRRYVQRASRRFDVIVLDLPAPSTGAMNRFYTLEFFRAAAARLREGGIVALGLPSAENYWGAALMQRNRAIYQTLRAVFPYVLVLPGETDFYLASTQSLPTDPAVWTARLRGRGIQSTLVTPAYLAFLLTGDRRAQAEAALMAGRGRLNRDLRPICYYDELVRWVSRFSPVMAHGLMALAGIWAGWVWLGLLVFGVWAWRRPASALPLTVGAVGWGGMVLHVALLLAFQARHGTLYQTVGGLTAAFMGGHTLGVWWGGRARGLRRVLWGGAAVAVGVGAVVLPLTLPPVAFAVSALLVGAMTGVVHPLSLRVAEGDAVDVARRLYAADLVGGCVGAVTGGVWLIPLLGVPVSWLVAASAWLMGGMMVRH